MNYNNLWLGILKYDLEARVCVYAVAKQSMVMNFDNCRKFKSLHVKCYGLGFCSCDIYFLNDVSCTKDVWLCVVVV